MIYLRKRIVLTFLLFSIITSNIAFANNYSILYNNEKIEFDSEPYAKDERIMVPLRGIFEKAGAYVSWDNESKTAFISISDTDTKIIAVKPDSSLAYVGENEVLMEVKAEVKNQRIMVPLRFIMDHLGKNVEWDKDTSTVKISD